MLFQYLSCPFLYKQPLDNYPPSGHFYWSIRPKAKIPFISLINPRHIHFSSIYSKAHKHLNMYTDAFLAYASSQSLSFTYSALKPSPTNNYHFYIHSSNRKFDLTGLYKSALCSIGNLTSKKRIFALLRY